MNKVKIEKDMTPRLIKDLGMRYSTEKSRQKRRFGLYECQYCGKEFGGHTNNIKSGTSKSCGCLVGVKHNLAYHRLYGIWVGMLGRCNNPNFGNYKYYGARGITVCEDWLKPKLFLDWCDTTYIEGMSLDRIDNDKGYSPENCRWADKTTQALNKNIMKSNTSGYVGVHWCKIYKKWIATLRRDGKRIFIKATKDKEEAIRLRNEYIINNNLANKLN